MLIPTPEERFVNSVECSPHEEHPHAPLWGREASLTSNDYLSLTDLPGMLPIFVMVYSFSFFIMSPVSLQCTLLKGKNQISLFNVTFHITK